MEAVIRRFVDSGEAYSQEQILQKVKLHGIEVTQSSLSRKLKKMGVAKREGVYMFEAVVKKNTGLKVIEIKEASPNMLVLKTLPAFASSVAAVIDDKGDENILGSIAGDDTIFLAINHHYKSDIIAKIKREFL